VASRGPQRIDNILSELMARRGYARVRSTADWEEAWREAVGELIARYTRVGALRRGALEVTVANSAVLQELTFQKAELLIKLAQRLPDETIRSLRFRSGKIA
jgi:predicted nucleic acid-binding Zn ribbon protein